MSADNNYASYRAAFAQCQGAAVPYIGTRATCVNFYCGLIAVGCLMTDLAFIVCSPPQLPVQGDVNGKIIINFDRLLRLADVVERVQAVHARPKYANLLLKSSLFESDFHDQLTWLDTL